MSHKDMQARVKDSLCAQCESVLVVRLAPTRLECAKDPNHIGIESSWSGLIRRRTLEAKVGTEKAVSIRQFEGNLSLTKEEAGKIVTTIWPDAPTVQRYKAANICHQYGLNPLMGHVFLVKFSGKKGEEWVTVIGIKATRLIASRKHKFSYIDNTPRRMTEAEELAIYGEADPAQLRFITKLKDITDGREFSGYGSWPKDSTPYGVDKGNSKGNMGMIRSERAAFDRAAPAEMLGLEGIPTADEAYMPPVAVENNPAKQQAAAPAKEEVVEGSFTEEPGGEQKQTEQKAEPVKEKKATPSGKSRKDVKPRGLDTFKTLNDALRACQEDFKLQPEQVYKELGYKDKSMITEKPFEVYLKIKTLQEEPPDENQSRMAEAEKKAEV
jgi:hypothetical protein